MGSYTAGRHETEWDEMGMGNSTTGLTGPDTALRDGRIHHNGMGGSIAGRNDVQRDERIIHRNNTIGWHMTPTGQHHTKPKMGRRDRPRDGTSN